MEKRKTIKELSHITFYEMNNYSQLVIDLVQETEDLFNESELPSNDNFGALKYQVDNVLEVIDKTRTHDVEALESLSFLLDEKIHFLN